VSIDNSSANQNSRNTRERSVRRPITLAVLQTPRPPIDDGHVIIIVSAWFDRWRSAFKTLDYKYNGKTLIFLKIFYDVKLNMAKNNEIRPFSIILKKKSLCETTANSHRVQSATRLTVYGVPDVSPCTECDT